MVTRPRMLGWLLLGCAAAVLVMGGAVSLAKEERGFVPPKAYHAKTYPAHDGQENEKVTVAVDPYDMPDKAAAVFTLPYKDEDFLPIYLLVSNDGDAPLSLVDMKVELVTVRRVKIRPATPDDIFRRFARQTRRGDEPQRNPLPVPLPRKKVKRSISKDAETEIQNAQFLARAVEPHSTQAGFFFFDVEGIDNPLAGARLYISGLRNAKGEELIYFEIPLEKYLTYRPGSK